jgi:predicted nucleic acid-binding protein
MLLDSDLLIDYLRGREPIRSRLKQSYGATRFQTTVVNQFELLAGAREPHQERATEELLGTLEILSLDSTAASIAGKLRNNLLRSGSDIGMADSLIAGIALSNNLPLLTRNRKRFEPVPNLKLIAIEENF